MACTEVIDPLWVEVIRSCSPPISVASVGWYPRDAYAPVEPALLTALTPFARAESGLASRLQGLSGAGRTHAIRIFDRVNWAAAFGWLAERHRLTLAPAQADQSGPRPTDRRPRASDAGRTSDGGGSRADLA